MIQYSLLSIKCDRSKPPPSCADAECIAIDSATQKRYLCKSVAAHEYLPATEWICASLARDCKIPVADWNVVEVAGYSERMFGSVWEGGEQDWLAAIRTVTNHDVFSDTLAFDMTVHNEDRHMWNYLFLKLAGETVVKVIDASRALLYHGLPLPRLPFKPASNTMDARKHWEPYYPLDAVRVKGILERIGALPDNWMNETIEKMPPEWLDDDMRLSLVGWWANDRPQRLTDVKKELS